MRLPSGRHQGIVVGWLLLVGGVAAAQGSVAGRWVAEANGQRLELTLHPDGRAELLGDEARWTQAGQTVTLSAEDGSLQGMLEGNQLTFRYQGVALVFRRAGAAAPRVAPGPAPEASGAKGFTPAKVLPGKTVTPGKGSTASFTVPNGWGHKWGAAPDGKEAYVLTPAGAENRGAVMISQIVLAGEDRRASMESLLRKGAQQVVGEAPAQVVLGPETFSVGGQRAGRIVLGGTIQNTGQAVEIYLGGVVVDDWAHVVLGIYEARLADGIRPGADTVLASLRASAPKENLELKRQLAGCWQFYQGSTDQGGGASSQATLWLNPEGTWRRKSATTVSVPGAGSALKEREERGTWRVVGSEILSVSEQGESATFTVRLQGGILYVGGDKYLPCG